MTRSERVTFGAVLVLILGGFAADVAVNYQPAKLSALFIVLAGPVLLAVHEVGHAVVARLVGWSVERIVIGFGRTWWTFRVGAVQIDVRTIPIEGFTRTRSSGRRRWRAKSAAVYAAGCGFELLIAGALMLVIGPEAFFRRSDAIAIIACQSVAVFVGLSCLSNLIPHSSRDEVVTKDGIEVEYTPNDGLGIVRSLFGPKP